LTSLLFLLINPLGLQHDALEFFENREVLVGVVDLGVALLLGNQEADLLQALELTLDVSSVFFDEFGEAADVRFEVGVLGVHDDNLPPDS
jgi:hypothetical protein